MRIVGRVSGWLVVLAFVCGWGGVTVAQTTADDVSVRLVGKVLFFRGMWSGNKLSFDADGQPLKTYEKLTFTESGLKVASVKMDRARLEIKGERVAIGFDPKGVAGLVKAGGKTTVNIDGSADFGKAVDAIFAPDLTSLIPSMPEFWQSYAKKYFLPTGIAPRVDLPLPADNRQPTPTADKQDPAKAMHVGGSVKPPKVRYSFDPKFTQTARDAKFSGNVQVYLWVDENGLPTHLRLVKPVGLGLDEAAIAAVEQYRFSPATQNGKPVKVDLYIDVNFQIF